jgi:hypothetical protein
VNVTLVHTSPGSVPRNTESSVSRSHASALRLVE